MEFRSGIRAATSERSFKADRVPLDLLTDSDEIDFMARLTRCLGPLVEALEVPESSAAKRYLSKLAAILNRLQSPGATMARLESFMRREPELIMARSTLLGRLTAVIESGLEFSALCPLRR